MSNGNNGNGNGNGNGYHSYNGDGGELERYEESLRVKFQVAKDSFPETLDFVVTGILEEIIQLRTWREDVKRRSPNADTSVISEKIVKAWKVFGDFIIEQQKLSVSEKFSFNSPYVSELVRSILDSVQNVLIELKVEPNNINVFYQKLNTRMVNLEEEVEKRVISKSLNSGK